MLLAAIRGHLPGTAYQAARHFAAALATGARSFHDVPVSPNPLAPPAFVFDIDGVLIRGQNILPAAKKAVEQLCVGNRWKYPVCFLTNGGGVSEAKKAEQLSKWLNAPVSASQVILSHTPMQELVREHGDHPVLVSGRGDVLNVAKQYGFKHVVSTKQLGRALPSAIPFTKQAPEEPGPRAEPCPVRDLGLGTATHPIRAVLCMTDPSDWYRDAQLIIDVVDSGGVPTRKNPLPGAPPVHVYFSNSDILWANDFPRNRFGQGAFATMVQTLYAMVGGGPLQHVKYYGKPNPEPYRLAEKKLVEQAHEMGMDFSDVTDPNSPPFSGIYAVGDNPACDVRGANAAGAPWVSILVRTGVFQSGPNCSQDPAHVVVDDVHAAVSAALHRTRHLKWHSMR